MQPASIKAMFSSAKSDWGTPEQLFRELNYEFNFDLDLCASHSNAKCSAYFDVQTDAFKQDLSAYRSIWVNPPYGRDLGRWLRLAFNASEQGAVVVCLVPSRTDTSWWHDYCLRGEIRFIRGRLRFQGARGKAPFPSAIVVFRHPVKAKHLEL